MPTQKLYINPDIRKAETLPAWFYRSPQLFELQKEKIFAQSWQYIGHASLVPLTDTIFPFVFMEHFIDEPMLLARQKSGEICNLSNVCTHRANLIAHHAAKTNKLICQYHGRRFGLNGQFEFMPEFTEVENFPRPCDNLHLFPLETWEQFLFTAINPAFDLKEVIANIQKMVGFLPLHEFAFDKSRSKDYLVNAHWALYCDNYLEGFHIPFVHKDLNNALDYGTYSVELGKYYVLQTGYSKDSADTFTLPAWHPDFGKQVAAYYYWIFPNMMFNFYPWGLSINIVKPITEARTRVSFLTYVYQESKLNKGAGALLDKVEREDEFVVEGVQKGIQSGVYNTGRYSALREQGVHHFHRILVDFLEQQ